MKTHQALSVVALLLVFASPPLGAAALRVVLFDVAPFSYRNDQGQIVGLHVDKARELAERAGYQAQVELTSFARIALLLEKGDADLSIGFETEPLRQAAIRLGPVMRGKTILLSRQIIPGDPAVDLRGLRLGRLRSGCLELQPERLQLQALHELNNYDSGLNMLASGRLDALCGTDAGLRYAIEQTGRRMQDYQARPLSEGREFWVFVSRRAPVQMLRAIEQAVAASPLQR